jgi:protease-4
MKFNPILSEIFRGQWLLDHNSIENYYPIIEGLYNGKKLTFDSKYTPEPLALEILDERGVPIRTSAGQPLQVPSNSIAQVKMIGEIARYGDWCVTGADEIVAQLAAAQSLNSVDATILKIDGPGGTVKAIGPFKEFAKIKTKPIIGLVEDALSLHYWAAVELCDYIIAANDVSARFGSVGVVCSFRDNQEAMEKMGIKFHEIYPDESNHKNDVYTLARQGKYELIKAEQLSPMAQKFQAGVRDNRPNLKEEVGVLTGKTFFADKALEYGMIDAIGGMDLAMEKARQFADQYKIKSLI